MASAIASTPSLPDRTIRLFLIALLLCASLLQHELWGEHWLWGHVFSLLAIWKLKLLRYYKHPQRFPVVLGKFYEQYPDLLELNKAILVAGIPLILFAFIAKAAHWV